MRNHSLSLALIALMAFAATPASAFFEANVSGGYTILNPSAFNDVLSGSGATNVTTVNSGYYVAADAGIAVLPFLKFGPRVSAIFANQGKSTRGTTTSTVDANIVPLELGLTADVSIPLSGLSGRVGVWGGYGIATLTSDNDNGTAKVGELYQGNCTTAEAVAAIRYSVAPFIALSLEAGYRLANVTRLDNADKLSASKDVAFDFGGTNLGGGLTFSF